MAYVDGRDYVVPDDAKQLAIAVLAHRVMVKGISQGGQRVSVEAIIRRIVDEIPLPT